MTESVVSQAIGFYGYWLTSPLGFLGHTCSLITFLSKTLRHTSTGLLFISLAISDLFYLSITIRDFLVFVARVPTIQAEALCRARTFLVSFSSMTASWTLVLIALDRWIRVRFPFQQGRICTQKVAICSIIIVCICSALFAYHVLQPIFGFTSPGNTFCGPTRSPPTSYSIFYFNVWPILQLSIVYLLPSCVMIVSLMSIYSKLRVQQNLVVASIRREKMQRQMLILMISTIVFFNICTVPYAIHRIIYLRLGPNVIDPLLTSTASVLINANYCYNFYIHCLSSQLFRETFIQQLKGTYNWCRRRAGWDGVEVHPLTTVVRVRPVQTAT